MTLKTDLLLHQKAAFEKLKDLKACALFMDMGTGKTRTTLEFIEYRKIEKRLELVIWLCPVSCRQNLVADVLKHSDYTINTIEKYTNEFICVCGIETVSQSVKYYTQLVKLAESGKKLMIVVDESHLIKNYRRKRTTRITNLKDKATYRAILSGTPITQGIWDLYTQMYFLHPQILGYKSFHAFARNHLEYSEEYPGLITQTHNTDYITKKINPYVYQITKDECLDLPPKTYQNRHFWLSDSQEVLYKQVKMEYLEEMMYTDFEASIILRMLTALHRVASGYYEKKNYEGEKLISTEVFKNRDRANTLVEVLESIDLKKNKVVVWFKYNSDLELISEALNKAKIKFVELHGKVINQAKGRALEKFENDKEISVLIANLSSGSYGLNLQVANYAVYYNNSYDYAKRSQSEDRVHRYGQSKKVHIIDIIAGSTIDERIEKSLEKKTSLIKEIRKRINEIKDDEEAIEKFKKEILNEW